MKLFIVPSWYPSRLNPKSGAFFRDHSRILQSAGDEVVVVVSLIHSFKNVCSLKKLLRLQNGVFKENGQLKTYRNESLNWFPRRPCKTYHFYQRRLIRLFEKAIAECGRPDVVIAHSSLFAGSALGKWLKDKNIPLIVTEHLKEFLIPDTFTDFQKNCIHEAYHYADRIVAVSSRLRYSIAHQFPESAPKISIIPNPVDVSAFEIALDKKPAEKPFVFLTVTFFRSEKRLDLLLQAFANVRQDDPDVRLVLVGDGPENQMIKQLIKELNLDNSIALTGFLPQTEIVAQMQKSHALVLPSEVETFGIVLIEAMACGQPVIATRCGGPEDIVTPETGFLVPVNDVAALTTAMQRMITDYRQFNPQSIRQIAVEKFGDHAYWQAIHNLCSRINTKEIKVQ
ncbi:MAG: glycosyltransferase [archaeon]